MLWISATSLTTFRCQVTCFAYFGWIQGMRIVQSESEFSECLSSAQREALAAFGNSQVLIEKYLLKPRHIEVQVFYYCYHPFHFLIHF